MASPKQKYLLDVGCGSNKRAGWTGMDKRALHGVDIVHDVEDLPWPLPDNSCGVILMSHLWEHLKPWLTIDIMNEMWRVLEPGGQLQMTMPHGLSYGYLQDPTHANPTVEHTFEYFDPSKDLYKVYRPKPWCIIGVESQLGGNLLAILETRKTAEEGRSNGKAPREPMPPPARPELRPEQIVDLFHVLQYDRRMEENQPRWMGYAIDKNPVDLWRYAEIIWEVKPEWIVELGTANGASALYFATLLDLIGAGKVITVDIDDGSGTFTDNPMRTNPGERPKHPRIEYIVGNSVDPNIALRIHKQLKSGGPVMVILDSNHQKGHVLMELDFYSPFVTKGSYLVVEDSNVNGHPVYPEYGLGAYEALLEWLPRHPEFQPDEKLEKRFVYTHNPKGWLRRIK